MTPTGRRFFFILLAAATVLMALVVKPLASALFLGAVLAGVLWPLYLRLSKHLWGRRGVSAGIMVVGVVVMLVGPLVAFSAFAIKEGAEGLRFVSKAVRSEGVNGLIDHLPPSLARLTHRALEQLPTAGDDDLAQRVQKQVTAQSGRAAAAVGATLSATGSFVFQTVMMLIALYFLLVEGDKLVSWLDGLSPLAPGQTRELLAEFKRVSFAVILSTVITAAVQALAALGGYLVARVPHPIFFAGVTFFTAFIPAVGAGAVCLAAALLLFATGHSYMALFLAAWGLLVVGLVDNLVKPLLIKGGMDMNGAVVFFALIGGLSAFGGVGLLLGPLVVSLFLALLRMYQRDFKSARPSAAHASHQQGQVPGEPS